MIDTPLWTAKQIATATEGRVAGDWPVTGLSIDSRAIVPGMVFFALDGKESDGHRHVQDALDQGAHGAIVSKEVSGLVSDDPRLIHVEDTRVALNDLAREARYRMTGKVIAVTGSVGKTGTREVLKAALGRNREAHASVKSYNNHVGVPLSLARMPETADYGIFEIGMNHAGEITPLVAQVRPDLAIITAIGPAHMAAFANLDQVADAKAEIFTGLGPDGIAVLNADDSCFERLRSLAARQGVGRIVTYGINAEKADIRPVRMAETSDFTSLTVQVFDRHLTCKIASPGRHQVANGLGVLASVAALDGDIGLAGLALSEITPLPGRGQKSALSVGDGTAILIDESYNASPLSVRSALEVLGHAKPDKGGRRIAVLGDMMELGSHAEKLHAGLAKVIRDNKVDVLYAIGPMMGMLAETLAGTMETHISTDKAALLDSLQKNIRAGDVISIKGANALGLNDTVDGLKGRMQNRSFATTGWTAPLAAAEEGRQHAV